MVSQVRLQPIVTQNVVTYATVIDVPNQQLKLKPGMTANVTIEIARKNDVIRVPNAALRFRPNADTFAALNQPVPPEMQRGAGRGGPAAGGGPGAGGPPAQAASSSAAPAGGGGRTGEGRGTRGQAAPSATQGQSAQRGAGGGQPGAAPGQRGGGGGQGQGQGGPGGGQNMSPEERRRRFEERMASMSPEERAQFEARMRERGMDPTNPGGGRGGFGPGGPGTPGQSGAPAGGRSEGRSESVPNRAGAETIDQLFGPLPVTETQGRVWLEASGQLKSVRVRLGITDGTYTELLSGELQAGQELVTAVVTPAQAAAASSRSPLMPGGPGGRGPGDFRGGMPGGGGQRGGGR
jgi:hypothetical protein